MIRIKHTGSFLEALNPKDKTGYQITTSSDRRMLYLPCFLNPKHYKQCWYLSVESFGLSGKSDTAVFVQKRVRMRSFTPFLSFVFAMLVMFSYVSKIFAIAPVVSNVNAIQRTDGSKVIDVYYDVFDADSDLCAISIKLSAINGASYNIVPTMANLSGDFGVGISSGTNKHIIWNAGEESYSLDGNYLYRVYADDGSSSPMPETFIFVEGGTFNNSTSDITLNSFYIDKYELTQAGYQAIMGINPASGFGVNDDFPVYYVSWYNAIEYCNRRSVWEGCTPCYTYSDYGTNPDDWPLGWNTDPNNHTNVVCSWTTNGYRLPTEMEWMFAAKGGNQTPSSNYPFYSGSDDFYSVGWDWTNWGAANLSPHIVGCLAPNQLGIYDMSGNSWEWVWDIYDSYPSGSQDNPTGASSGSLRIRRGGSWDGSALECSVFNRDAYDATFSYHTIGFRICRVSP